MSKAKEKEHLIEDGYYYAPLWTSTKTGNTGFICAEELVSQFRSHLKFEIEKYRGRLQTMWGLTYTGKNIRLKWPDDKAKYPIVEVEEGGTVLPFALTEGPMFDKYSGRESDNQRKNNHPTGN